MRELAAGRGGALDLGHGARVQVEFASVNPTGPLHVGHGRVAVIGLGGVGSWAAEALSG